MPYVIRTAREKQRLVAAWRRSGVPRTRFALEHGVSPTSLAKWAAAADEAGTQFLPVRVVDATPPPMAAPFVVQLAGAGHRVEVPTDFDPGALRRLVAALC